MSPEELLENVRGIYPPIATPLTEDREFDEDGMRRLVRYLLDGGVHGIFTLGSTGEFPMFTLDEKRRIVEVVVEAVEGRVPVMAGAADTGTKRVVRNVKAFEGMGVDCVVVTPPYYYVHSQEEIIRHFRKVLKQTSLPVFIYNNLRNNVNIEPDTVSELAKNERIIGIKDSSGYFNQFQELIRRFRNSERFKVFQGEDDYLAASFLLGADGAILTFSNLAPRLCVDIYEATLKGDVKRAIGTQSKLTYLLINLSNIVNLKSALNLMGICGTTVKEPFTPITESEKENVTKILKRVGLL